MVSELFAYPVCLARSDTATKFFWPISQLESLKRLKRIRSLSRLALSTSRKEMALKSIESVNRRGYYRKNSDIM